MGSIFQRATKEQSRVRVALCGVSGSGKTYSALRIARGLGGRIALIDSERGSSSKYSDEFDFDLVNLYGDNSPKRYIEFIEAAAAEGFDILVIDSLSHAWAGEGGELSMVDAIKARDKSANSFNAWRFVTPWHNKLVDAILGSPCHVIATMRTKAEYVVETVNGKATPRKIGMAPIQRDGMEYEFDVVGDLDQEHQLVVSKTRCRALDGKVISCPDERLGEALRVWCSDGVPAAEPEEPAPTAGDILAACKALADVGFAEAGGDAIAPVAKREGSKNPAKWSARGRREAAEALAALDDQLSEARARIAAEAAEANTPEEPADETAGDVPANE